MKTRTDKDKLPLTPSKALSAKEKKVVEQAFAEAADKQTVKLLTAKFNKTAGSVTIETDKPANPAGESSRSSVTPPPPAMKPSTTPKRRSSSDGFSTVGKKGKVSGRSGSMSPLHLADMSDSSGNEWSDIADTDDGEAMAVYVAALEASVEKLEARVANLVDSGAKLSEENAKLRNMLCDKMLLSYRAPGDARPPAPTPSQPKPSHPTPAPRSFASAAARQVDKIAHNQFVRQEKVAPKVVIPPKPTFSVILEPCVSTSEPTPAETVRNTVRALVSNNAELPSLLRGRPLKNGKIALDVRSEADQVKIAEAINNQSIGFSARAPAKFRPRLCVKKIRREFLPDECNIVGSLCESNPLVFFPNDEPKFVTFLGGRQSPVIDVVIEVSPETRSRFVLLGRSKLKLGGGIFDAADHIYVKRCTKCFALNHSRAECNAAPMCGICGVQHATADCPHNSTVRAQSEYKCCITCKKSNAFRGHANSHCALDTGACPTYKSLYNGQVRKIDFAAATVANSQISHV